MKNDDIDLCNNTNCKERNNCYRFTHKINRKYIYSMNKKDKCNKCNLFIDKNLIEEQKKFSQNLIKNNHSIDPDFSKLIDENFWDLV